MKYILTAYFFIVSGNSFAQTEVNWYKTYTGKVGNIDATLHLIKAGKSYSGYMWFLQNQWPMQIGTGDDMKSDSITIQSGNEKVTFILKGILTAEKFAGNVSMEMEGNVPKKNSFELRVNADKNFTVFTYASAKGNAKLPPQMKNESECNYDASLIWPAGSTLLDETLKKTIKEMLNIKSPETDPLKFLTGTKNNVIAAWKKDNASLSPKDTKDLGLSLSYEEVHNIELMYENERLLTLSHFISLYTGGAHNSYSRQLSCFDKHSGKQLKIGDVVTSAGLKALPGLLDQIARIQFGITNKKPLEENGFLVNVIQPSKNFYVTESGIGFIYAPYEVKSFSEGEVTIIVPFKAINTYLTPGFKK